MAARTCSSTMLCLIQCGETDWDRERRILGAADLPLSASGRAQVVEACAKLLPIKLTMAYHGGDEAASETAAIAARAASCRVRTESDLHDPALGMLEGVSRIEFEERFPSRFRQWCDDPLNLTAPEGEPIIEARSRILGAIGKLARRNRSEEFGVVLHSFGIALVRAWLAAAPSSEVWSASKQRPLIERYSLHESVIEQMLEADSLQTAGL